MPSLAQCFPVTDPTLIFFVVLSIILLAPIVMARLRIPHIIGMVLAGVVIGRYGLHILERDASFELFGHVGLLYIMFLAGLEMNVSDLRRSGAKFALFGALTFVLPFAVAYAVGISLLHYSTMASMLLASILAANTLIAYPIVCKYGLQRHPAVTLSVGSSMLALTLALLVLAAIVGVAKGEAGLGYWIMFAVRMAVFCAATVWVLPRLTRWFFRKYSDSVMLYIYVLAVLFLSAAVSKACGLEGIFGAFLAGLVLNRFIPQVSPLMNRIEFIGNAIFIPYFLIGVGMMIDVSVAFHSLGTLYVIGCIVLFGTLGKAAAAYLTRWLLKMPKVDGHMMFGLTEAHAAGGIAMTMIGMRLQLPDGSFVVDNNMLNGVVIMILASCIISSIVVERASAAILIHEKINPTAPATDGDDEKILLPLQHRDDADQLVRLAMMMRNKRLNRGLIGLNVVYDDIHSAQKQAEGRRLLEAAEATAVAADVRMQTQNRLATNIANGIKHAFRENDASEIIMGLHRRTSANDNFWGAYTEGLINDINRQILICRLNQPLNTIRQIHVAVPSRVEYEAGFFRWVERLARLTANLGCRITFHGRQTSLSLIGQYLAARHADIRADYREMKHWKEVVQLADTVQSDHLLAVITARVGTVSYKLPFEKLPEELTRHFSHCSLMIVFPDQHGLPQDTMTFTAPQTSARESAYAGLAQWIRKLRFSRRRAPRSRQVDE